MTAPEMAKSFVARIWLESVAGGQTIWRGHVRHVQGTQECHFQHLGQLRRFLEEASGYPMSGEDREDEDDI